MCSKKQKEAKKWKHETNDLLPLLDPFKTLGTIPTDYIVIVNLTFISESSSYSSIHLHLDLFLEEFSLHQKLNLNHLQPKLILILSKYEISKLTLTADFSQRSAGNSMYVVYSPWQKDWML